MKNKIQKLLEEHKLLCTETEYQLNELMALQIDKFSAKEKLELKQSINELELEKSLRRLFITDLESLM